MMTQTETTPLQTLREKANLTRLRLAAAAGVGLNTLWIAERTGFLSPAMAARVAAVLGVSPDELVGGPLATSPGRRGSARASVALPASPTSAASGETK
jgi:transcriptional regulator with XRE-family HTH domain